MQRIYRTTLLMAAISLSMTGCSDKERWNYSGYQIDDHFPLDGQRSWEYASDDISVAHKLEVRMSELTTSNAGTTVHEFQTYNESTGSLIRTVQWSADSSEGVLIHSFQDYDTDDGGGGGGDGGGPGGGDDTGDTGGAGGPGGGPGAMGTDSPGGAGGLVSFMDSPVIFGDPEMAPGESVTSSGGGWTFTSTFEAVEPCHNHWTGEDWNECLRFFLDDGVEGGASIAGYYWVVPRYGIAWMELENDSDVWRLVTAKWAASE